MSTVKIKGGLIMRKVLIGIAILVLLGTTAPSDAQVPENQKICGLEVEHIVLNLVPDMLNGQRWKKAEMLAVSSEMCNHYMEGQGVVHMANVAIGITLKNGTSYFNIFHPHFAPDGEFRGTSRMFQNWQPLVGDNWKKEWCGLVKSDRPEEFEAQGCK